MLIFNILISVISNETTIERASSGTIGRNTIVKRRLYKSQSSPNQKREYFILKKVLF